MIIFGGVTEVRSKSQELTYLNDVYLFHPQKRTWVCLHTGQAEVAKAEFLCSGRNMSVSEVHRHYFPSLGREGHSAMVYLDSMIIVGGQHSSQGTTFHITVFFSLALALALALYLKERMFDRAAFELFVNC